MKNILIVLLLLFSSCEIFEVSRVPLLAPPLGLEVFTATGAGGVNQLAVRFQGNNREVYFSGYRIYISVNRADLELTNATNRLIGEVPPPPAVVLPNLRDSADTEMSVAYNGAMTKPEAILYPHTAIINTAGVLENSSLISFNGGTPFTPGTTYFVGVYAYSRPENTMSLPSIGTFTFP